MVCGIHPCGVEGDSCKDFKLIQVKAEDKLWQPEGASYYGDELVLDLGRVRSQDEQMDLLDSHPLFTGRCPNCEMPIASEGQVHWDCGACGWVDDSV